MIQRQTMRAKLSLDMTISQFYATHYRRRVLEITTPRSEEGYLKALALFAAIVGDLPLASIDSDALDDFKAGLIKHVYRRQPLGINTVIKHLNHIQWILDQIGPSSAQRPSLRTATGLFDSVPWTKPPRKIHRKKKPVSDELIEPFFAVLDEAKFPQVEGIKPGAWWRGLLSTIASTSLRLGQVLETPLDAVDFHDRVLILPPEVCRKSKTEETHPLHIFAIRCLLVLRGNRKLLFPWPHAANTLHKERHRLQTLAGIPVRKHYGFHAIRRNILTKLARESPAAAQLAAGHESFQTTLNSYVGEELLAEAIDNLDLVKMFNPHS